MQHIRHATLLRGLPRIRNASRTAMAQGLPATLALLLVRSSLLASTAWLAFAVVGCVGNESASESSASDASPAPTKLRLEPDATPSPASARPDTAGDEQTWPTPEQFATSAAALGRPWTLVRVRRRDRPGHTPLLAVAHRVGDGWVLGGLMGEGDALGELAECARPPCPWPTTLEPERALAEPPALPAHVLAKVAYARTLLEFEGALDVHEPRAQGEQPEDDSWLPEAAWTLREGDEEPDLVPHLERLRRFHPQGFCSMDQRPQQVSLMRALAAAQAGRTGWAVQGWVATVGYWSSSRMVWSSYGQSHPQGHGRVLERVGVDLNQLLVGLAVDLPGARRVLSISDVQRLVSLGDASIEERFRLLAEDPAIDPLNRALFAATVMGDPFSSDPLYARLPSESQVLLDIWSR